MKFIFSTVYRVTQKDFYALPYTSMWAPFVAQQISKRYSSSCHMFISKLGVRNSTASMIRCLKSARSRTFLLYTCHFRACISEITDISLKNHHAFHEVFCKNHHAVNEVFCVYQILVCRECTQNHRPLFFVRNKFWPLCNYSRSC